MITHADKTQENKRSSVANAISPSHRVGPFNAPFFDNRPVAVAQRKWQAMADHYATQQPQFTDGKGMNTRFSDHQKTDIENRAGLSPKEEVSNRANGSIIQGVFIIGKPLDGSYYNKFSVEDTSRYLAHKYPEYTAEGPLRRLNEMDKGRTQKYPTWDALVEAMCLSDEQKEEIDEGAFERAKNATEHLLPDGIKVDWQYQGNIAEATTRFVENAESPLGFDVMIDVNEADEWPDYNQIYYNARLGQRTTLFIHELAYHANKDAFQRMLLEEDDPDIDHRSIFLPATREKYFIAFLNGLRENVDRRKRSTPEEKKALITSWYEDVQHHIEEYQESDEEAEEAMEWLAETKAEVDEILSTL